MTTKCTQCTAGTYSTSLGKDNSACDPCTMAMYCPAGSSTQIICKAGELYVLP
jgi:acetyl-CoA carboxylase beta subunit